MIIKFSSKLVLQEWEQVYDFWIRRGPWDANGPIAYVMVSCNFIGTLVIFDGELRSLKAIYNDQYPCVFDLKEDIEIVKTRVDMFLGRTSKLAAFL
jgi:hypothetical protein